MEMSREDYEFLNPSEGLIRAQKINGYIDTLNQINEQIAELKHIKEQIEIRLSQAFGHPEEGRRTYVEGKYAICITSGWNYKLNKKEYELMKGQLNPEFNPVKEKISYYVSAPEYRKVEEFGSKKDIEWLSKLMPKEPAKIRVQIELSANSKR